MFGNFKKIVLVLVTSAPITKASKNGKEILEKILCIYYLFCVYNDKKNKVKALINSKNKVNAITLIYVAKLCLKICYTNVKAQKIENFSLEIFKMVLANFKVENKQSHIWYFQKTFLLADVSLKMILEIFFFILSNANIFFQEKKLMWRFYAIPEALFITKRVLFISKKKFVKMVLNIKSETFVLCIAVLKILLLGLSLY